MVQDNREEKHEVESRGMEQGLYLYRKAEGLVVPQQPSIRWAIHPSLGHVSKLHSRITVKVLEVNPATKNGTALKVKLCEQFLQSVPAVIVGNRVIILIVGQGLQLACGRQRSGRRYPWFHHVN